MAWHAKKSASGSKQWIKCPGSLAYIASLPEHMRRPTGAAAMLGTCAHGLGELCLVSGTDAHEYLGKVIWLDANEDATVDTMAVLGENLETRSQLAAELGVDVVFMTRVDDKMAEGVQLYLDVCREALAEAGPTAESFVERRFNMDWLRPGLGGTADYTVWQFLGLIRVIDYKNGFVAVSADDNTQALTYGLGMAQEVDWMFDEMEVVIVQPNSQGQPVKRWSITKDELKAFQERLAEASDKVDEAFETFALIDDQPAFIEWAGDNLSAGEDEDNGHCTFCDALGTCPVATMKAEELAMADFAEDPLEINPLEIHDEESLVRLTKLLKWGKWLDNLVKAANTLGQRRLEQGLEVPGHKLVAGKTNRAWVSTDNEVATLITNKLGVAVSELYEEPKPYVPKLKSPAQMEKLGAARSAERKKAKELVAELTFKPKGKLALAPDSDPREAVTPSADAADDFVDDVPWEIGDE